MQTLNTQQQVFQQIKAKRLDQLINGGLLKRADTHSILSDFTATIRRTLRTLSHSIDRECVILAVVFYVGVLC